MGLSSDALCLGRCPTGRFSSKVGLTSQEDCLGRCSAGKWSSEMGLSSDDQCSLCPTGKWSSEVGLTSAMACSGECSRGTYSDQKGLISVAQCKVCASNKYQDEMGKTICKGCPDNMIIVDTATPSKHDTVDDCVIVVPVCDASEYLQDNQCKPCSESFTCDGTVKLECPPGFYCTGSGPAIACPKGRYGELKSQINMKTACQECLSGTYQNVVGQTYCSRGCPRGKFGDITGAKNELDGCKVCPVGYMCASLSMNRPTECPMGSYQDEEGQEMCTFCPRDTYSATISATGCRACGSTKDGHILRTTGLGANSRAQCERLAKTCPVDERPDENEECHTCPKGFYANGKGTRCILCPKGYASSAAGSSVCLECSDDRCHQMFGSAEPEGQLPSLWKPDFNKFDTLQESDSPFPIGIVIVYSSLAFLVILLIVLHRLCPDCFKHADLMFSGDHLIEDTHARRILNTRLGAAFTVSLPFIVAGLAVFVFTSENKIITNGLVPIATTEIPSDDGLYKTINIAYKTESASKASDCSEITTSTTLNCTSVGQLINPFVCQIKTKCLINPPFGGQHTFYIQMADRWQTAVVEIVTGEWNHSQYNITSVIQSEHPLAGTLEKPTTVDYDVIRSKSMDHIHSEVDYGLQMTVRDTNLITTETGTEYGVHVTALRFFSTETLFVREVESKLGIITRIGTILTLLLSAISGLRVVKLGIEKCIDSCYSKLFESIPGDIARRVDILEERDDPEERSEQMSNHRNPLCKLETHTDAVTGRKYTYDPISRESTWVSETSPNII